jgi:single-strand DNA-binding protein
MESKRAEAEAHAQIWVNGFSRPNGPAGGEPLSPEARKWAETTRSIQLDDQDGGQTSVPEAAPRQTAKTRTLGQGAMAGTLTADPELRFSQGGKALVKVRLAVSERRQDRSTGKWTNGEAEFFDVTVWGKQGEYVVECLRKGDRVVVVGDWQESTWLGKDEIEHTTKSLKARDIGPSLLFRQVRVVRNMEGS